MGNSGERCGTADPGSASGLAAELAARSLIWPEVRTDVGPFELGWIAVDFFIQDDAAIEEYLAYEGSFHEGTDLRTCAASMMVDVCYVFALATVPLFVRAGIVPDLSPQRTAMKFHLVPLEHDGRVFQVRRAHVRYLSHSFWTDRGNGMAGAIRVPDHHDLCQFYRHGTETYMGPLVRKLAGRTGLSSNALWRLVADAIAGRFLDVGRRFGCLEAAKQSAMTILKQPGSPLDNRQLHFFDLTLRDEAGSELLSWTFRARGGCCRYYTIEEGAFCETCVLRKPQDRDGRLLTAMRERYAALECRQDHEHARSDPPIQSVALR